MCDNTWDDNKAKLVCMQLGLGSLGLPTSFGPGTGSLFLDNVICSEYATVLAGCGHYGVDITLNCDHSKDVGVKCFGTYV